VVLQLPFSQHEPIATTRLVLRPFELTDRAAFARLQRTPGIADYLYWETPDDAELDRRLAEKVASTQLHAVDDQLSFAIDLKGGTFIGNAVLVLTDVGNATLEVGYTIHPDFAGRGFATEAARSLVTLAFECIGAHRVTAKIDARNVASRTVLERAGLRLEGHFLDDQFVKGEWTSEMAFAVLESEYFAQAPSRRANRI